jgi:cell shape-determining protein MreD
MLTKQTVMLFTIIGIVLLFEPFTRVSLTVSSVVAIALVLRSTSALLFAFGLGLLLDVRQLSLLGQTSLMLVMAVGIIQLLHHRFSTHETWLVTVVTVVSALISQWWWYPPLSILAVMAQIVVTLVMWRLLLGKGNKGGVYLK